MPEIGEGTSLFTSPIKWKLNGVAKVARIVDYIQKHLVGKTLAKVKAQHDEIVFGKVGCSAEALEKAMAGKKVLDARQQGKYFWWVSKFYSRDYQVTHQSIVTIPAPDVFSGPNLYPGIFLLGKKHLVSTVQIPPCNTGAESKQVSVGWSCPPPLIRSCILE